MRCSHIIRLNLILIAALVVGLVATLPAEASLIVTVQSVSDAANTNGDSLNVTLTNSGPGAVSIGGFSFKITASGSSINFTDANVNTTPSYIFGANSTFGPDLTSPVSGSSISASDVDSAGSASIASGATVGLGYVLFNVAANGSGVINVTLGANPQYTSAADGSGTNLPILTLTNGTITVTSTVPEPSTLVPLAMTLFICGTMWRRSREI
jgi:hypothetical protein